MNTNKKGIAFTSVVAWLALILAIGALALGWWAYNRAPGPDLSQNAQELYNDYYQRTRLQIGILEINNNLEDAREDIRDNDFESALSQVEEAEADLQQLEEDLNVNIPSNNVFDQLKQQIQSQNREASLSMIDDLRSAIQRIGEQIDGGLGRMTPGR